LRRNGATIDTGKGEMEENMNVHLIHTVSLKKAGTVSGTPAAGIFVRRKMKRFNFLIPFVALFLAVPSFAYQKQAEEKEEKVPEMTDEEKEMLRDREILENLVLLKNLDTIKFLDLLYKMDPDWSEKDESVIPEEKEEEDQKK
jgi:hypothetical protein